MDHMIIGLSGQRDDGSSAGAGKSEVARILVEQHGFTEVGLADSLKRTARDLYKFSDVQLWGGSDFRDAPDMRYPRKHGPFVRGHCACCGVEGEYSTAAHVWGATVGAPQCFLTPRFALQTLGTDACRILYEDTWVDLAMATAETLLAKKLCRYDRTRGLVDGGIDGKPVRGIVISDVRWPAGNEGRAITGRGGALWRVYRPGTGKNTTWISHTSERQAAGDETFDRIVTNDGDLAWLERNVARALGALPKEDF